MQNAGLESNLWCARFAPYDFNDFQLLRVSVDLETGDGWVYFSARTRLTEIPGRRAQYHFRVRARDVGLDETYWDKQFSGEQLPYSAYEVAHVALDPREETYVHTFARRAGACASLPLRVEFRGGVCTREIEYRSDAVLAYAKVA